MELVLVNHYTRNNSTLAGMHFLVADDLLLSQNMQVKQIIKFLQALKVTLSSLPLPCQQFRLVITEEISSTPDKMFGSAAELPQILISQVGNFLANFVRPATSLEWYIEKDASVKKFRKVKSLWLLGNEDGISYEVYRQQSGSDQAKFGQIDKYLQESEGFYCWHCTQYFFDSRSFGYHQALPSHLLNTMNSSSVYEQIDSLFGFLAKRESRKRQWRLGCLFQDEPTCAVDNQGTIVILSQQEFKWEQDTQELDWLTQS